MNDWRPRILKHRPGGASSAVVLLVSAYVAVACSVPPRRTPSERTSDAVIAVQVEATLLADPTIYARHVDVTVDRGVVRLGGYVWSAQDFRVARQDAASVAGVKSVVTEMELMRGGTAGTSR
jgi:osmotically-inducible protein OsmY